MNALTAEERHFISDAMSFLTYTFAYIDASTSFITNFAGEITKQR